MQEVWQNRQNGDQNMNIKDIIENGKYDPERDAWVWQYDENHCTSYLLANADVLMLEMAKET